MAGKRNNQDNTNNSNKREKQGKGASASVAAASSISSQQNHTSMSTASSNTATVTKPTATTTTTHSEADNKHKEQLNTTETDKSTSKQNSSTSKKSGWTVVRYKYKKVNGDSVNCRVCTRGLASLQNDSTPDRQNRALGNYTYKTRVTLQLKVEGTDNMKEAVLSKLQEFLGELSNADKESALLPWKRSDAQKGKLDERVAFPTELSVMRVYATKLYTGKQNESITTYPNLYIGHSLSFAEIRRKLQQWLQDGNHGMYRNMLQVENSSEIGFLVYSCREMDAGALADEMEEKFGFSVGLRWKTINTGKRNLPRNQQIKALIVEVDASHRHQCQKELSRFYRRTTRPIDEYPNGIRLRFAKSWDDAINTSEKRKIEKLRMRQKDFLASIRTTSTYDILDLDNSPDADATIPTLRQMVMSIRSKDDDTIPLFHCVDLDYTGSGYSFIYSNDVAEEAECAVNTLIPYLRHFFPEATMYLDRLFEESALDRCDSLVFDAGLNEVIDTDVSDGVEIEVDEALQGFRFGGKQDRDDDTSSAGEEGAIVDSSNLRGNNRKQALRLRDDDSISTFGGKSKQSLVSPPRRRTGRATKLHKGDNSSVVSGMSTSTMDTIKTLREETNQKFDEIRRENAAIREQNSDLQTQLRQLCNIMQNNSSSVTPSQRDSPPSDDHEKAGERVHSSSGNGLQ